MDVTDKSVTCGELYSEAARLRAEMHERTRTPDLSMGGLEQTNIGFVIFLGRAMNVKAGRDEAERLSVFYHDVLEPHAAKLGCNMDTFANFYRAEDHFGKSPAEEKAKE